MNKNLYKNGILTLYLSRQPQYTVRQYYASGGIVTLVPRKGFFLGGIGDAIGDFVGGVGDALGDVAEFAGDIVDSPIGRIGLTLLAPQLGIPMWAASAGLAAYDFARTGKISPSALVSAGLGLADYTGALNFGGAEIPVDEAGGFFSGNAPDSIFSSEPSGIFAGNTGPVNPIQGIGGGSYTDLYEGTSLARQPLIQYPDPMYYNLNAGNTLTNYTPTQNYVNNSLNYNPVDESGGYFSGTSPESPFTQVAQSREQILGGDIRKPGYFGTTYENLKTAFNPTSNASAMDRLSALSDVGSDTFKAMFYNKNDELNVPAVLSVLSFYPNYAAAKAKARDLGIPFDEATYQANKVAPSKERYAMMAPKSSFGITTAATGGRIGFDSGGPGNKNEPPKPKPKIDLNLLSMSLYGVPFDQLTSTQKNGLFELADTQKANGGRIGFESGKLALPKDGPNDKYIKEQMMKAAKQAQEEYAKRKAQEQLLDQNYKTISDYEWKRDQKELFDAANEKEYPPLPTPTKPEGVLSIKLTPAQGKKKGGKISKRKNYLFGNVVKASGVVEPVDGQFPSGLVNVNTGEGIFSSLIKQIINQNPQLAQKQPYVPTNRPVNDLYQYYLNKENDEEKRQQIMSKVNPLFGIKKAYGGMIDHPVRMLQGGVPELDLRAKGGFIPYGVKERADDVPAMLSKNEFVFTADAVRNAGGGSINKGAQKMYKLMKSLENKKINKKVA
jgi:hypothetical protein